MAHLSAQIASHTALLCLTVSNPPPCKSAPMLHPSPKSFRSPVTPPVGGLRLPGVQSPFCSKFTNTTLFGCNGASLAVFVKWGWLSLINRNTSHSSLRAPSHVVLLNSH